MTDILGGRRLLYPDDDVFISFRDPVSDSFVEDPIPTSRDAFDHFGTIGLPYFSSRFTTWAIGVGRMYDLATDTVVEISPGGVYSSSAGKGFANDLGHQPVVQNVIAKGDFTGDGFDDFAFIQNSAIHIITAADVNDPSKGFFYSVPTPLPAATPVALAAGDFDGSGVEELALASTLPYQIVIDIYKPQVTRDVDGHLTSLSLLHVGHKSIFVGAPYGPLRVAMTAGVYSGKTASNGILLSQLVVMYQRQVLSKGVSSIFLQPISIAAGKSPNVTLSLGNLYEFGLFGSLSAMQIKSGFLDFSSNTEQLVAMVQPAYGNGIAGNQQGSLYVLTLDSGLNISLASSLQGGYENPKGGQVTWTNIGLGNFDQPRGSSLSLEVAISYFAYPPNDDCIAPTSYANIAQGLEIVHINPANNFELSSDPDSEVNIQGLFCYGTKDLPSTAMALGDAQGRSAYLGLPTEYQVQHTDPQLVLGTPPMEVDYVPAAGQSSPTVFNVSAVPDGFFSRYTTSVTNSAQSSSQSATSWANAVKETATAGYEWGGSLTGSVSVSASESAGFLHKNFMKKQYSQLSTVTYDASTTTGPFGDQIWYNSLTQNFYVYPVIGQFDCPIDKPKCSAAEKKPAYMIFSLTLPPEHLSANGSNLEWYQPVHEAGNVFSYPWDLDLLKGEESNPVTGTKPQLLTSSTGFFTDGSTVTESATWSDQKGAAVTSGTTNKVTWGSDLSVTLKAGELGGASGGFNLSYNGSVALSTLTATVNKMGASKGIGVTKPGTFPNPDLYQYDIVPYVLGDTLPRGTADQNAANAVLNTSGILRAEFTADPLSPAAGSWWKSTYTLPDVAVAHPARWSITQDYRNRNTPNCIRISATSDIADCASFMAPTDDIWTSEFYWMKGLFITGPDAQGNLNGAGPQMSQTTAGKPIYLQTRVYNDSIAPVPPGDVVAVQFYVEPWDETTEQPLKPENAKLIEEVDMQALPGFGGPDNSPNWTVVGTKKLDTSSYGGEYLAFWVFVYIKNPNGNLVAEMPDHGLTGLPTLVNGVPTFKSIEDVLPYLQAHSNNVGFYKQLLYVSPGSNAPPTVELSQAGMSVSDLTVTPSRIELGQAGVIAADINTSREIDGLSVTYKDASAGQPAKLFDVDEIPHIKRNHFFLAKTVYHANVCGVHTLSVDPLEAPISPQALPTAQVTVFLDGVTATQKLIDQTTSAGLPKGISNSLLAKLRAAWNSFFLGNTTAGLNQLKAYGNEIQAQRGKEIPTAIANELTDLLGEMEQCISA